MVTFCSAMAAELEQAIPTIVIAALDNRGDLPGATVAVDDQPPVAVDGRPLRVDPGSHRLVARAPDGRGSETTITVAAGEKNRRIELAFTSRIPTLLVDDKVEDETDLTVPIAVAFGVGGAGLLLGAITGAIALAEDGSIGDACPTPETCPADQRDAIDRMEALGTASTVGFVVGGIGVAVGVVLLIVGASDDEAAALRPTPSGLLLRF